MVGASVKHLDEGKTQGWWKNKNEAGSPMTPQSRATASVQTYVTKKHTSIVFKPLLFSFPVLVDPK